MKSEATLCQETARHEEIIQAARSHFAQHGFTKVSLRDIAGELGISVGNLTYYFPHKADLIAAVLEDFRRASLPGGQPPATLEELREFLNQYEIFGDDTGFLLRSSALCETDSHMRRLQVQTILGLHEFWAAIFKNLVAAELMAPAAYPGHHEAVSQSIQMLFRHRADFSRTETAVGNGPGFQACVWAILFPLLTEAGQTTLKQWLQPAPSPHP